MLSPVKYIDKKSGSIEIQNSPQKDNPEKEADLNGNNDSLLDNISIHSNTSLLHDTLCRQDSNHSYRSRQGSFASRQDSYMSRRESYASRQDSLSVPQDTDPCQTPDSGIEVNMWDRLQESRRVEHFDEITSTDLSWDQEWFESNRKFRNWQSRISRQSHGLDRKSCDHDRKSCDIDRKSRDIDRKSCDQDSNALNSHENSCDLERKLSDSDRKLSDSDRKLSDSDRKLSDSDRKLSESDRKLSDSWEQLEITPDVMIEVEEESPFEHKTILLELHDEVESVREENTDTQVSSMDQM